MKATTIKQKLKSLRRLLCHLHNDRVVILVEGKKDVHALRRLRECEGYEGESRILQISTRKPYDIVQLLNGTRETVIILTDCDKSGDKLMARYAEELSANDITIDTQTRRSLRWILGIRTMEELPTAYADFVAIAVQDQQMCWQPAEALTCNVENRADLRTR